MMLLTLTDWILIFLATAYATYIISDGFDGPLHVFKYLRAILETLVDWLVHLEWLLLADLIESFKDLMDCYVCLSFWVALGILYLVTQDWLFVHALAVAGMYVGMRKLADSSSPTSAES